jgi:hypothetical protein
MPLLNNTGIISQVMTAGAQNLTGELVGAFLFLYIIILAVLLALRVPLEWLAILILPLSLSLASYFQSFMVAVVLIVIYFAGLIAQKWLFK